MTERRHDETGDGNTSGVHEINLGGRHACVYICERMHAVGYIKLPYVQLASPAARVTVDEIAPNVTYVMTSKKVNDIYGSSIVWTPPEAEHARSVIRCDYYRRIN